jgi:hypothetical protein
MADLSRTLVPAIRQLAANCSSKSTKAENTSMTHQMCCLGNATAQVQSTAAFSSVNTDRAKLVPHSYCQSVILMLAGLDLLNTVKTNGSEHTVLTMLRTTTSTPVQL